MKMPILVFFATIVFFPTASKAQTAANFCDSIKNTTNLVVCLNRYYNEMKLELADDFETIIEDLDPVNADDLRKTQQIWINYRDAECTWETRNEAMQSLKRVKELYCLVRLTKQRQDILRLAQSDLEAQHAYQGITPRWENVLNDIYGDIYWKANSHIKADLNCNGREENLILGMRNVAGIQEKIPHFVIGLVESPAIGKPSARVFEVPLEGIKEDIDPQICAQNIEIAVRQNLQPDEHCEPTEVEVKTKPCGNFVIRWQGGVFDFVTKNFVSDTIR